MLNIPNSHIHQCVISTLSKIVSQYSDWSPVPSLGSQASPGNTPQAWLYTQLSGYSGVRLLPHPRLREASQFDSKASIKPQLSCFGEFHRWQELSWPLCETSHPLTLQLPQSTNFPAGTVGSEYLHMQKTISVYKELSSLESKCLHSC